MLLTGVLTFQEAVTAIDFNTLALLLGMMLLIVVLQKGGFFTLVAVKAVELAATPGKLLVSVVVATAVFSAFLVNDVVVLLFTPVIISACRMKGLNPVPYLIGEAMASNIGSTATIVGNPQNMLIGVTTGISFSRFFAYLSPVAVVSTLLLLGVLWVFYSKRLTRNSPGVTEPPLVTVPGSTSPGKPLSVMNVDHRALRRSVPVLLFVTIAFFVSSLVGLSIPLIALTAGVIAMLVSGIKPSEVIRNVDWVLLLFFGGLFVVIGGARQAGVLNVLLSRVDVNVSPGGIFSIHLFSAIVSQLVSNVPLTVLMIPLLERVPGNTLWISLAAGATLGGNATLIGAVANIIVAEQAYREGILIRFWEFFRVGVVVTFLTLVASVAIILLEFQSGFLR